MPRRKIDKKSEGKHVGHACEGHFRGITEIAVKGSGLTLARKLPFTFHVDPDVVVLDKRGRVHTVVIVAFWNDAKSSEKKFYRCRSEYAGVKTAVSKYPGYFVRKPVVSVVLYGAAGGWKEQVLGDLKRQCSPCFFLPDTFSKAEAARLSEIAFSVYKPHWESGKTASRAHVEKITSRKKALTLEEKKLLALTRALIERKSSVKARASTAPVPIKSGARLPAAFISTRYRQPLGALSVFPKLEIEAWKRSPHVLTPSSDIARYALRAHFLGLGAILEKKGIGRSQTVFEPSAATRRIGGRAVYAPDLLDFRNWEEIPEPILLDMLESHRDLTRAPGSVFKGGAFDQCIGNWSQICAEFSSDGREIVAALKKGEGKKIAELLSSSNPVGPEAWHPASGNVEFYPTWAIAVSTLACLRNDRGLRANYNARTQKAPSIAEARRLAETLLHEVDAIEWVQEAIDYCDVLLLNDPVAVPAVKVPQAFSLENPSSMISDFYNTLTTNSSHNPLCRPVRDWLDKNLPNHQWHGWPTKRSASVAAVLGATSGRRQWQFIGVDRKKNDFVAAEVKSITANNWGNKSKEIYDRVAETRAAARELKRKVCCIGVLDGDFSKREFAELSTGLGYDEVYSIKEILGIA